MTHTKTLNMLLICGLVFAAVVAFEEVRLNGFVFDDSLYITGNPNVQGGITSESVVWALTTPRSGSWHPLTWLSHLLDCSLFGLNASWHHVINLLFHILNTVLLFLVLTRMTDAVWPSAFVAAVFAVHPLHVESVAWVAERKDVLSATFWILTMAAYARYVERPRLGRYLLVVLGLALGLMSKPMLVTLPFVLLLLDYWPLGRWRSTKNRGGRESSRTTRVRKKKSMRFLVAEKIPLFIVAAVFAVVTLVVQKSQGAMLLMETAQVPVSIRIGNGAVSYVTYIVKTFCPVGLAVFYPHRGENLPMLQVLASFVVLILASLTVIYAARRGWRYVAVGWLWYLGTLVPVIGLVQVGGQAAADRYTYLPSIGILMIVAWGAAGLFAKSARWPARQTVLRITVGVVLVALVVSTRAQVRYWRNSGTLYTRALEVTKNNYVALYNLGRFEYQEGRTDNAIKLFNETLRLLPESADAHNNLGVALRTKGRYDEAIEHFREALRANPNFARAHNNLGQALGSAGRVDEAVEHFEEAIRIQPDFAKAHYNLSYVRARAGRIDEAFEHCEEALRIDPHFAAAAKLREYLLQQRRRK